MKTGRSRWWADLSIFFALMVVLATWAIGMPLFTSPDEAAHLYKAYGTAHGQLLGATQTGIHPNTRIYDVPAVMGTPDLLCYFGQPSVPAACAVGHDGATASTAAVYPPPWYLIVGLPPRVVDQATHQRAYRMTAATLAAALVTAAFAVARRAAARRFSPLLFVALPPMTLFVAATVNPNGFEIAGFLLLWSLLLHARSERGPSAWSGLLVGGLVAALALSRFASLLWLVVALAVAVALLGTAELRRYLRLRFLGPALGASAAGLGALVLWSMRAGADVADLGAGVDWSTGRIIGTTLSDMPTLTKQMIGVLGWLDTPLPGVVYLCFAGITAVAVAGVALSRDRRIVLATVFALVGLVAVPVFTHVVSARTAGLFWQGRYSLPLFASIGVLGMLGWQRALEQDHIGMSAVRWVRGVSCGCFALAEVVAFWWALRRFTVGTGGRLVLLGDLPWSPDVAPWLLQLVNAAAVAALCSTVLRSTNE